MHNLAPIIRQLRRLIGTNQRYQSRCGDFSWVGGEDAVDFFPDLQFGGGEAGGEEGGEEVGVAAADLGEERAGDGAEETCEMKWIV